MTLLLFDFQHLGEKCAALAEEKETAGQMDFSLVRVACFFSSS